MKNDSQENSWKGLLLSVTWNETYLGVRKYSVIGCPQMPRVRRGGGQPDEENLNP
jgi:hypothetical protein